MTGRSANLLLAALGAAILFSAAGPALTRAGWLADPLHVDLAARLEPPSPSHWLGTDESGRDTLSRVLHGALPSLTIAVLATVTSLFLGIPSGALAGARGGGWDLTLTRLMEATTAIPTLPLILLVVSLSTTAQTSDGSTFLISGLAIGAVRWATIARYVRGGIARSRAEGFAAAAEALGSGRTRMLVRHLLPSSLTPALVSAAFGAGNAVLLESALSFLGLGTQPPAPSWGRMIASAAQYPGSWWLLLAPGLAVAGVVGGANLLAERLRREATELRGQSGVGED